MAGPPSNGSVYRIEQLEKRQTEFRQELRDVTEEMRDRAHKLHAEVDAANLICRQLPDLARRLEVLERHDVGVIANRLSNVEVRQSAVEGRLDNLGKATWGVVLAVFTATLTFAVALALGAIG
jgi:chromosome segregation ATPase